MTPPGWLSTGAILGAAAVGLGAFGAHGLKSRVTADLLAVFETAARYHLIHALAIVAVAWAAERYPGVCATAAGWLFLAGIVLFSGSLYALVLTGVRGLGAITPLGGLAFIAGWILLALAPFTARPR
jgi:uncharacterized membrane protein YgdD (TMEM256/DUF423 family)